MDDNDSASSSSSGLLSPFANLRHGQTQPVESETLQADHDTSWIGARVSPVQHDNEEDLDEEDILIAPYRKPLLNKGFATERSALLGQRNPTARNIHPLWEKESSPAVQNQLSVWNNDAWLDLVWVVSGVHLSCIGIHDLYMWYLSYRLGKDTRASGWRLPWLSPSDESLVLFGAFDASKVMNGSQWWRILSSALLASSVAEWLLGFVAWQTLIRLQTTRSSVLFLAYLAFILLGQASLIVCGVDCVAGGVSFGTSGVLCLCQRGTLWRRLTYILNWAGFLIVSAYGAPKGSTAGVMSCSLVGILLSGLKQSVETKQAKA